ncbi:MAG: glycosidase [Patescibacteria group bacterium]
MIQLKRNPHNPIIKPRPGIWWEKRGVFNPGVIFDGEVFHLLYRAVGADNVSRFGYAYSVDGVNFLGFRDTPAFAPFEGDPNERLGCEDPRLTCLNNTYYIAYTAVSLRGPEAAQDYPLAAGVSCNVRVGLASTKNFSHFDRLGMVIGNVNTKDAALFPAKIDDHYLMLHRVEPDIWIAYSKDLSHWHDHKIILRPRSDSWDSKRIGGGAPPLATPYGWLLFYHGVDGQGIYHLGIVVLDLKDPARVLYRSVSPVFSPAQSYEKRGNVNNVVFTCGVVERADHFWIYYGAADLCIGLATVAKEELLEEVASGLKHEELPQRLGAELSPLTK